MWGFTTWCNALTCWIIVPNFLESKKHGLVYSCLYLDSRAGHLKITCQSTCLLKLRSPKHFCKNFYQSLTGRKEKWTYHKCTTRWFFTTQAHPATSTQIKRWNTTSPLETTGYFPSSQWLYPPQDPNHLASSMIRFGTLNNWSHNILTLLWLASFSQLLSLRDSTIFLCL